MVWLPGDPTASLGCLQHYVQSCPIGEKVIWVSGTFQLGWRCSFSITHSLSSSTKLGQGVMDFPQCTYPDLYQNQTKDSFLEKAAFYFSGASLFHYCFILSEAQVDGEEYVATETGSCVESCVGSIIYRTVFICNAGESILFLYLKLRDSFNKHVFSPGIFKKKIS